MVLSNCYRPRNSILMEMAVINHVNDNKKTLPRGSYTVELRSDDHNPPHVHVYNSEFEVKLSLENGELIDVVRTEKNGFNVTDVIKRMKLWLQSPHVGRASSITNQTYALDMWDDLHNQ